MSEKVLNIEDDIRVRTVSYQQATGDVPTGLILGWLSYMEFRQIVRGHNNGSFPHDEDTPFTKYKGMIITVLQSKDRFVEVGRVVE